MKAAAGYPHPDLADNARTVRLLLGGARGERERDEAIEWGRQREARLPLLSRLVGLLEERGIIGESMGHMARQFAINNCAAIAARHGLDMGYTYRDSMFGPFSALLGLDLHAARPVRPAAASGLFGSDAAESAFLADISGKAPRRARQDGAPCAPAGPPNLGIGPPALRAVSPADF